MITYLLLISLPILTFAQDECKEVDMASQIMNHISGKECPTYDEIILKRVEDEYKKNYGSLKQVKKSVAGVDLLGSTQELSIANEMLGKKPPKGWPAAAVGCETVLCSFEKLFGSKEAAMQVMNIKAKTGYSLSLDQSINQGKADQIWSAKEVREMDSMASKMPPELRNLPRLSEFERQGDHLRGHGHGTHVAAYASPGYGGAGSAQLVTYDAGLSNLTNGKNPYEVVSWPQEVFIHELCHHHDYKGYYATNFSGSTSSQKESAFRKISGWKEVTDDKGRSSWKPSEEAKFVSGYARSNPAEDYAESCMNYILHPQELKSKAPEKYAYMKEFHFKNKEFTNEIWTNPELKAWPKLDELLADESTCNSKIAECIKSIDFSNWNKVSSQVETNECFNKYKKEKITEMSLKLEAEENFCEMGGTNKINEQLARVCGKATSAFINVIEDGKKADLKPAIEACEFDKDYTVACVLGKANLSLTPPPELEATVANILKKRVPDRMAAIGNKLADTKTSQWLKGCLKGVKTVEIFQGTINDSKQVQTFIDYSSGDPKVSRGFIGRHLWENYDRNDVNKTCANGVLNSLANQGYKIPESGFPVNIMKSPFLGEFQSFENEILKKIPEALSGCVLQSCKDEKILILLKTWEGKSPEKRSGIATPSYAAELRSKLNVMM
jgi:hypothetical protein